MYRPGTIIISKELPNKNYNAIQIRSVYGTMHTLPDAIKANMETCFVLMLIINHNWISVQLTLLLVCILFGSGSKLLKSVQNLLYSFG